MDETTAQYCSEYVAEYLPEKEGPFKYRGYEINQWIQIKDKTTNNYSSSSWCNLC